MSGDHAICRVLVDDVALVATSLTTPQIITQPASRTVVVGSSLQFSVTAYGPAPLSCQWRKDGADLPGFTDRICTLVGVFTNDVGSYLTPA